MFLSANLDPQRLAYHPLEWRRMPRGRPQFELGVAARADL
jgi:hypothetical protein